MASGRITLLRKVIEEGVGAPVEVVLDSSGARTALQCYFSGLTVNQGPVCAIVPWGLKRHRVTVTFGRFAAECVLQMQRASAERLEVARALMSSVASTKEVRIEPAQNLSDWQVVGPEFAIEVLVRDVDHPASEAALAQTGRSVMVPLMAAMAELIGYDDQVEIAGEIEGATVFELIAKRERSPRNRILCLSVHGHKCAVCGFQSDRYKGIDSIIEVHHLEPLGLLESPRPYNPVLDLVPLCPNCHRAIHKRRPVPYSVEELKEIFLHGSA